MPNLARGGPAAAILASGEQFFVDVGEGAARAAVAAGLDLSVTRAVFLTHYHVDHFAGLAGLLFHWFAERKRGRPCPDRVSIVGPSGLGNVRRGFLTAFGDWLIEPGFELEWKEVQPPGQVGPARDVNIRYERVDHSSGLVCLGYRFTEAGRVLAISGDSVDCAGLRELARDADVLLADSGRLADAEASNHIATVELGKLAAEVGVKKLILTHFTDPGLEERLAAEVRAEFRGETVVAADGDSFVI